jgi:hypothetical protein
MTQGSALFLQEYKNASASVSVVGYDTMFVRQTQDFVADGLRDV